MGASDNLPVDPDYGILIGKRSGVIQQEADDGKLYQRLKRPDRRVFRIVWNARPTDELESLRKFYDQFRGSGKYLVFEYKVWVNDAGTYRTRKFPVEFNSPLEWAHLTNEAYNIEVELIEAVGRALAAVGDYPDPATGHDFYLIEEDDPQAAALVGTWTSAAHANASAGNEKTNPNTNTTDKFRFTYAGYGFQLYSRKGPALGIYDVLLDGADIGDVDLYNATDTGPVVVFSKLDAVLGLHTVDILAKNTKNASSTGNTIVADAIRVMP